MKKVLIKLLTSILIVMILFQFMVIEKTNIVQAVEAATGLATHKIQVFKMTNEK